MNAAPAPAVEIEIAYHPNIRASNTTPRSRRATLVRETKTLVIVRLAGIETEIRISKKTGVQEGFHGEARFQSHYELAKKPAA